MIYSQTSHIECGSPRAPFKLAPLVIALLCALYVLSPIDLLPEAFLGPFGLPDDIVAVFIGIRKFKEAFASSS